MANNLKFTGWDGKTNILSSDTFDISMLNIEGRAQSSPQISSKITTGPVSINTDRPKTSQITPGVKQSPVASVNSEPNPDFSKATRIGVLSRLSSTPNLEPTITPFTAGTIDTSFPYGINTGFDGAVYTSKVQSDGKILVGGNFEYYEYNGTSYYAPYFIRLNTNGSPDFDFMYTYHADEDGWNLSSTVKTIDIQSDGKIVIGGEFNFYYENVTYTVNNIIRFNSDGTYDNTFLIGDGFNGTVTKIIVLSNDKILVGGEYIQFNNNDNWRIIRLNSNGTKDVTFNTGDGIDWDDYGIVYDIVVQSTGKIILGGDFYNYNGDNVDNIVRLNTDGSYDNTFIIGDGFNDIVYTLALQSDDKIIVGGTFNYYDNVNLYDGYIVRLAANGQIDTLFGQGFNDTVRSIYVQSDDKILVGGNMNTFYIDNDNSLSINQIVRFHSNCTFDYSFDFDDTLTDTILSITLSSDDKIYIGGEFIEDGAPYLLNHFGRINNSILQYPYVYTMVACSQPLFPDTMTTYVVGSMTPLSTDPTYSLQSLQNPSITVCGFIDLDIYPSNVIEYTSVNTYNNCEEAYKLNYKLAVVEDCLGASTFFDYYPVDNKYEIGDILYIDYLINGEGLYFDKFAGTITDIIDWNSAGMLPPFWEFMFGNNYVTYSSCNEAIETNGVIYVALDCITEDAEFPLIHKNYYDNTSLLIPSGDNPVKVLVDYIPSGPYYLISGGTPEVYSTIQFTGSSIYNSLCEEGLSKISPSGVLNPFFENTGFLGDLVYTMVELPDGGLLVGGNFDEYLENTVGNFMRINSDGSFDETFNSVYSNSPVWSTKTPFSVTSSGSIYFDGTPLCELNANTDTGVWDLGNNNLTFEWFQYFTGDVTHLSPTAFDYSNNDLRVFFQNGNVSVVIDGDTYSYGLISPINDVWCHIAVTRFYDEDEDEYIWRVFQDGIQLGQFTYSFSFNQDTLIIGNSNNPNNNRGFKGYITNFRVNNGAALYVGNFDVPTEPLNPNYNPNGSNTVLCLSVNDEPNYILDNSDDEIQTSVNTPANFRFNGFNSYVRAITLQPDGKILVGGDFNTYNNSIAGKLIRLNSDGSVDEGFTSGGDEFNSTVRAIAVQRDGKIVCGGDFNNYYTFYCPQIARLNPNGTFDQTFVMGDGFDGDQVFTINIETFRNDPFYVTNGPATYTENIVVGGWFNWYNGTTVRGIVKLSSTGEVLPDFGEGFNVNEGSRPRVNQILTQPDGKIVVIGGGNSGGHLRDYNDTWIPQNIVRLVKDSNGIYQIDDTFTTNNWDNNGGFNGLDDGAALSISLLPNGKYMVGGQFNYYGDNNNDHSNLPYLIRLNSDGTLDETFTFNLDDDYVNKVLLLSSGILLVGGRFETPKDLLLKLFIGEEYELRSFTTCDGDTSNIFLPTSYEPEYVGGGLMTSTEIPYSPISTDGLDIVTQDSGGDDDSDFLVELPFDFDVNFLGVNYTSVWIGTNSYLTFGGGSTDYGIDPLPGDIPAETGLPGVYISTREDDGTCLDSSLVTLYTGTTDGGNTTIIRFEGNNNNSTDFPDEVTLIYNFKFYKDQSNYFDLIIEQNNVFCNDDPTGGISNGVDTTWVTSFDTSSEKAYRLSVSSVKPIRANVNDRAAVCGSIGDTISTPNLNEGAGTNGSMYFNGTDSLVTIANNTQMDLNYGPWTVEWYQKYTSTDTCCRRVFDIGQFPNEEFGVSIESNNTILLWMSSGSTSINLNTPVYNVWSYFAITSENTGGFNQVIRVYQDGVLIWSGTTAVDINNFQGDPQVDLPLVIGGGSSGDNSLFQGYITNFRWTKGTNYYSGPTMDVPTIPLEPYNSQLLFLTPDEAGLLTNECEVYNNPNHIPANEISGNNVTWSTETPFVNLNDFSLFTATNTTSYGSCSDCGQLLQTILYVRDGANPNYVLHTEMSPSSITNVLTNGPIFTLKRPECYEILKYTY